MELDYRTRTELEGLKNDISSKNTILEAEKYIFATKLQNGFGEDMVKELTNPSKPKWYDSFVNQLKRKIAIRKYKKQQKKINKYYGEQNISDKTSMDFYK